MDNVILVGIALLAFGQGYCVGIARERARLKRLQAALDDVGSTMSVLKGL
jgi:hypothetical protein